MIVEQNWNYFEIQAIAPYYITLFLMPPPDLWPPEGGPDMQVIMIMMRMMIMAIIIIWDGVNVMIFIVIVMIKVTKSNHQTTAAPEEEEGSGFGGIGRIMQVGENHED